MIEIDFYSEESQVICKRINKIIKTLNKLEVQLYKGWEQEQLFLSVDWYKEWLTLERIFRDTFKIKIVNVFILASFGHKRSLEHIKKGSSAEFSIMLSQKK